MLMKALFVVLVLCVLAIVGVAVRTYLHIQQHRKQNRDTDSHKQDGPEK